MSVLKFCCFLPISQTIPPSWPYLDQVLPNALLNLAFLLQPCRQRHSGSSGNEILAYPYHSCHVQCFGPSRPGHCLFGQLSICKTHLALTRSFGATPYTSSNGGAYRVQSIGTYDHTEWFGITNEGLRPHSLSISATTLTLRFFRL